MTETTTKVETTKQKTVKQQIIDYAETLNGRTFTAYDVVKALPDVKKSTIATTLSRDLVLTGKVKRLHARACQNRPQAYALVTGEHKKMRTLLRRTKPAQEPHDPNDYATIGKALETLLQAKNETISVLEKRIEKYDKRQAENEERIQELERHIRQQGQKIHELSEKARRRNTSIKLDELQAIVNGKGATV